MEPCKAGRPTLRGGQYNVILLRTWICRFPSEPHCPAEDWVIRTEHQSAVRAIKNIYFRLIECISPQRHQVTNAKWGVGRFQNITDDFHGKYKVHSLWSSHIPDRENITLFGLYLTYYHITPCHGPTRGKYAWGLRGWDKSTLWWGVNNDLVWGCQMPGVHEHAMWFMLASNRTVTQVSH